MPHIIEKISTKAKTLFEISLQLEVFTRSYGPPKWQEYQFQEFRDFRLESPRKNDIWM